MRVIIRPTKNVPVSLSLSQLKRVRETDGQMKPLLEKNRRMSKKNEELLQTLQRMEDKLKSLSRENAELVGVTHTAFEHYSFTHGHTLNHCFSGTFPEGEDNLGLPASSAEEDQLSDRPKPHPRGARGGVSASASQ